MKILSFGAGMQSTALALMSCENSLSLKKGQPMPHPDVPIYDLVIFCDLGMEPSWVMDQVMFTQDASSAVEVCIANGDMRLRSSATSGIATSPSETLFTGVAYRS